MATTHRSAAPTGRASRASVTRTATHKGNLPQGGTVSLPVLPHRPPPSLPAFDVGRVLHEVGTAFNPLHRDFCLDFEITGARDGYTLVTFALPDGMTWAFVQVMDSFGGFLRAVHNKSTSEQARMKIFDPAEIQKRKDLQTDFTETVCALFDVFIDQGHDSKEATKRTNFALKAQNHPWATFETVQSILRKEGRFRKKALPNRRAMSGVKAAPSEEPAALPPGAQPLGGAQEERGIP